MERPPARTRLTMIAALAAVAAAGCASTGPTADPRPTEETDSELSGAPTEDDAVTLTMGNALMDMPDQLIAWAAEVRGQTGDSISFDVVSQYGEASGWDDREQLVLEAVASGELDLGWVGARAVPSFAPLLAPMLVDSHDLQEEVFAAGIPQQMLADAGVEGVTGLGVLPGPHRRMLGVTRDFRTPEDFASAVVMSEQNAVTLQTLAVLGVTEAVTGVEGASLEGMDGLVAQVGAVLGNRYHDGAQSFTTNLNLWPRPLVLVINTSALQELPETQQDALLAAADDSFAEQMEITRQQDALSATGLQDVCSSPLELVELTEPELLAFQAAVEPVHVTLAEDETSAVLLDQITALKAEVGAPPDVFSCDEDAR